MCGKSAGEASASIAAAGNLLRRNGTPEEIAAMARALCGPAGRDITGQALSINRRMYLD